MGDLAFNIEKFVDLNKVVTLDIDKLVNVNVNNPDILATAEADAEAFGPFALAEVDAYTYVSREGDSQTIILPGQVDAVGNAQLFLSGGDGIIDVGEQLTVDHVDVDDINGFDQFADLSSPPPDTPDAFLPALNPAGDLSFDISDKVINITAETAIPNEFVGVLDAPVVIDFGVRTLDSAVLLPENQGPANFSITIAAGTEYLVEQLLDNTGAPIPGDFELEFNGIPANVTAQFGGVDIDIETIAYTQEAAGIGQVGEWNFDFLGNTIEVIDGGVDGEAFAYAESSAALDLL